MLLPTELFGRIPDGKYYFGTDESLDFILYFAKGKLTDFRVVYERDGGSVSPTTASGGGEATAPSKYQIFEIRDARLRDIYTHSCLFNLSSGRCRFEFDVGGYPCVDPKFKLVRSEAS